MRSLRLLAPLAMMAAIFYFSAQPFDGPELAGWEVALRKLGHFGGYALLTGLWWWALVGAVRRPLALAAAISIGYAVTDEYHQTFVDNRHGSALDVGVDALGVAFACLSIRALGRRRSLSRPRPSSSPS